MRLAVIVLACLCTLATAQLHDVDGGNVPKGLPLALRSTRFQRLPSGRPAAPTQSVFANSRLRRPVSFKPRGQGEDGTGNSPVSFPSGKAGRPNLPTAPAYPQHVKPVNEEPEEDDRTRESVHDDDDDDRHLSQEQDDSDEESEENVARAVANLGNVGNSGISRSGNSGASVPSQGQLTQIQYRPFASSLPTGRGGPPPPTSAPPAVQYRPAQKPNKPRKQIVEEPFKQQVKPASKPVKPSQYDSRGKKPVAQIIRRYRNDNPDGSITWGFENDDGSYKEELIGVDCITRGKYGYIDPDGIRREYTYETGIKCDEEQREEDEENGFVDYQENKLVLPDGKTIDLSSMGKKQTRRPRPYGN